MMDQGRVGVPLGMSQPFLVEKYGCLPRTLHTTSIVLFLDNVGGWGVAAVFWRQDHPYVGHTLGRVSGTLPSGRWRLEGRAADSYNLLKFQTGCLGLRGG